MIEELEKMANLSIPKDFSSDEANNYLKDVCAKYEIKCAPPETTARLLDKVSSLLCPLYFYYFIEHKLGSYWHCDPVLCAK